MRAQGSHQSGNFEHWKSRENGVSAKMGGGGGFSNQGNFPTVGR